MVTRYMNFEKAVIVARQTSSKIMQVGKRWRVVSPRQPEYRSPFAYYPHEVSNNGWRR